MAPIHRPSDAARLLGIPASTLRRWSQQFNAFLSPSARKAAGETAGSGGHRRYTEEDVQTLAQAQRLLGLGLNYDQARAWLSEHHVGPAPAEPLDISASPSLAATEDAQMSGAAAAPQEPAIPPALSDSTALATPELLDVSAAAFLAHSLHSLSDSQQIILANQQTARQLLGVLLQDNFNLKEENARLRERMLEAERRLFEVKREMDANQSQERERMRQMEQHLFDLQRRMDGLTTSPVRRPALGATPAPAPTPALLAPLPTIETPPLTPPEPPPPPAAQRPNLWQRLWGRTT